jgi:hypothetical protein
MFVCFKEQKKGNVRLVLKHQKCCILKAKVCDCVDAADIANAVLDGVDGILLGAETLRGEYPVDSVSTIAQICR